MAFAAKELCSRMLALCEGDLRALRRLARYLPGAPQDFYHFSRQDAVDVDTRAGTDGAGCTVPRRSTSGGCAYAAPTS